MNRIVDPDCDCVELVENLFFLLGYVKLILSGEFWCSTHSYFLSKVFTCNYLILFTFWGPLSIVCDQLKYFVVIRLILWSIWEYFEVILRNSWPVVSLVLWTRSISVNHRSLFKINWPRDLVPVVKSKSSSVVKVNPPWYVWPHLSPIDQILLSYDIRVNSVAVSRISTFKT